MTRSVQALVGSALLVVLSGAPFLAVLCAQWCLDGAHDVGATASHSAGSDCHDDLGPDEAALSTAVELPCGDHDAALAEVSVLAAGKRVDGVAAVPDLAAAIVAPAPPPVLLRARVSAPPRAAGPAPSHTILRI